MKNFIHIAIITKTHSKRFNTIQESFIEVLYFLNKPKSNKKKNRKSKSASIKLSSNCQRIEYVFVIIVLYRKFSNEKLKNQIFMLPHTIHRSFFRKSRKIVFLVFFFFVILVAKKIFRNSRVEATDAPYQSQHNLSLEQIFNYYFIYLINLIYKRC